MKLKDKLVVITGSSSGLGEVVAYKVAEEGAKVILISINEEKLKKVNENIHSKGGASEYLVCDIRDLETVRETIKTILSKHVNVDILVNNAGIWTDDEIEKLNPNRRKEALETNALGNIQFTDELLPHFQEKNSGYIFNVISTSGASDTPAGDNSAWKTYGATKWAMTGYTKALIDSLKNTKIKITGFHPGGFESDLYENANRANPHNQPWMMKTEDVADVVLFALTRPDDVQMEKIVVTKIM